MDVINEHNRLSNFPLYRYKLNKDSTFIAVLLFYISVTVGFSTMSITSVKQHLDCN